MHPLNLMQKLLLLWFLIAVYVTLAVLLDGMLTHGYALNTTYLYPHFVLCLAIVYVFYDIIHKEEIL